MKVSIITRHFITNYGSLCQSYALQRLIESMGYEVDIINYIRDDEDYRHITSTLVKKSKFWNKNFLTRFIYKILQNPNYIIGGRAFETYRQKYLNMTRLYSSFDELEKDPPEADIYCTGSDQVWGAIGNDKYDKSYFLEFASDKKCISYAASFGKVKFDSEYISNLSELVKKYSALLMREKSAVEILEKLKLDNVKQVLDPTLLLDKNEWLDLAEDEIKEKDYVLIYQLHRNKRMDEYAKEFTKRAGLKLIRVSPSLHHINRGGKFIYLPTVGEFLSYINNARYIITDSFHGTAFAINFNKDFVDILPGETATRNQSILELTGLEDRILSDYSDFSFIDRHIDYDKVDDIICKKRKESLDYLSKSLKN